MSVEELKTKLKRVLEELEDEQQLSDLFRGESGLLRRIGDSFTLVGAFGTLI